MVFRDVSNDNVTWLYSGLIDTKIMSMTWHLK